MSYTTMVESVEQDTRKELHGEKARPITSYRRFVDFIKLLLHKTLVPSSVINAPPPFVDNAYLYPSGHRVA